MQVIESGLSVQTALMGSRALKHKFNVSKRF